MNAGKINQNGKILDLVRHPHESENRNCFYGVPDSEVVFFTDAQADTITNIGTVYSHDWDMINNQLITNPDYSIALTTKTETERIMAIKKKASELIVSNYPEKTDQLVLFGRSAKYLQMNMATRTMQLLSLKVNGSTLSQAEQDEFAYLESVKTWTTSIRDLSNQAEINNQTVDQVSWPAKPTDHYV